MSKSRIIIRLAPLVLLLCAGLAWGGTVAWQYDSLNRLTRVDFGDGRTISYQYDAVGNRTARVLRGPAVVDTDGDGLPDSTDPDDDNDGVPDAADAFPLDRNESVDTDRDGIGNNADPDDDNDGLLDAADNCPLIANPAQTDGDRDGAGDACDPYTFCRECLPGRGGWRLLLLP